MRRLILKKMNGKRKVSIVGLRQKLFAVILTMAFVHRSDAMPTNPGSLKQNIMTADISGSDLLGAGNGGGTAIGGGPQQINPQDPKLTPVRGTKDEQCSDKEMLIMKLQHDLKDAECTLQSQMNDFQRALANSNVAERQVDRFVDQQLNVLNQALNVDRAAICHAQEVASAKACRVRQQPPFKTQSKNSFDVVTDRVSWTAPVGWIRRCNNPIEEEDYPRIFGRKTDWSQEEGCSIIGDVPFDFYYTDFTK
nr:uncharacterized protein LOC111425832 isoform X1 [Onthophagus taurus]